MTTTQTKPDLPADDVAALAKIVPGRLKRQFADGLLIVTGNAVRYQIFWDTSDPKSIGYAYRREILRTSSSAWGDGHRHRSEWIKAGSGPIDDRADFDQLMSEAE